MPDAQLRRLAAAACLALAAPAPLAAQTLLTPGVWSPFEWFLGVAPVDGRGFLLDATTRMQLRVIDAGVTGDAFDVFVNGVALVGTPSVAGGIFTGAYDGDAAWADGRLSGALLFLNPGRHTITLAVRETAPGYDYGEGFVRADVAPTAVPEPSTAASLALGLLVLARRLRRRARA